MKFRGDIKGSCKVDISASASSSDAFGSLEVRAYGGTLCGFEAEEVSGYADLSFEL